MASLCRSWFCTGEGRELRNMLDDAEFKDMTNPKDLIGIKKPNLQLVPASSLIYQALAMQHGAIEKGYGAFNWRDKKVKASVYLGAALRHIYKYMDGQNIDEESGYPELGHAIASLGILVDAYETGCLVDDRPKPGCAAALLDKHTKKF